MSRGLEKFLEFGTILAKNRLTKRNTTSLNIKDREALFEFLFEDNKNVTEFCHYLLVVLSFVSVIDNRTPWISTVFSIHKDLLIRSKVIGRAYVNVEK